MALPDDPQQALALLKETYPLWVIRKSDIGRWWAIWLEQTLPLGCSVTVHADTLDHLDDLLEEQECLRQQLQSAVCGASVSVQEPRWYGVQDLR